MVVYRQLGLVDYVAGSFNQLSLWNISERESGFGCICVANNTTLIWEVNVSIKLVVGTAVTPSQLWKISPQFGAVCCEAYSKKALGIEGGNLKLVCPDSSEATQVYIHFLYVVLEFMSRRRYVFKSSTLIAENKAL